MKENNIYTTKYNDRIKINSIKGKRIYFEFIDREPKVYEPVGMYFCFGSIFHITLNKA